VTEGDHLATTKNNWLAAIEVAPDEASVAFFDVSTSELRAARFPDVATLLGEIARAAPREIVLGARAPADVATTEIAEAVRLAASGTPVRDDGVLDEASIPEILGDLDGDA